MAFETDAKKSMALFWLIMVCGIFIYYCIPKTITYCGGGFFQSSCQRCTCRRGFPAPSAPFGGSLVTCTMGPVAVCKDALR